MTAAASSLLLWSVAANRPALAEDVPSPPDGEKYIAGLIVLSEICAAKYPALRSAIDASWEKGFDQPTFRWFNSLKGRPDFQQLLAQMRLDMGPKKDELVEQCMPLYGPRPSALP